VTSLAIPVHPLSSGRAPNSRQRRSQRRLENYRARKATEPHAPLADFESYALSVDTAAPSLSVESAAEVPPQPLLSVDPAAEMLPRPSLNVDTAAPSLSIDTAAEDSAEHEDVIRVYEWDSLTLRFVPVIDNEAGMHDTELFEAAESLLSELNEHFQPS